MRWASASSRWTPAAWWTSATCGGPSTAHGKCRFARRYNRSARRAFSYLPIMPPRPLPPEIRFRIRIRKGETIALGPGKIDLLEAIERAASLTAAAKDLGMSYRRAWLLLDTMNRSFREPVVE